MRIQVSDTLTDENWDRYAEGHEFGQFQQASAWAEAKAPERWSVVRIQVFDGEDLVGGAQVLQKRTRLGWVGFINKGPLVSRGRPGSQAAVEDAMLDLQSKRGYRALIVHPADGDDGAVEPLRSRGFALEKLLPINTATLMVDVGPGWEAVNAAFRRTTRREIRQAGERGVSIVEASAADVSEFFDLMSSTCKRQGASPNPANLRVATALVEAFAARGKLRLWFAVHGGRRVAGGLAILFGNRVNFWKKGWDQTANEVHANTLTTADIIRWGADHGFRWVDFAAMDRNTAQAMIAGRELPPEVKASRDFFNLGFGGQGFLMPPCLIRFGSPLLRFAYRVGSSDAFRPRARRLMGALGLAS